MKAFVFGFCNLRRDFDWKFEIGARSHDLDIECSALLRSSPQQPRKPSTPSVALLDFARWRGALPNASNFLEVLGKTGAFVGARSATAAQILR